MLDKARCCLGWEEGKCGKLYSRTAVGDAPERTRRSVPDMLNASCVVPEVGPELEVAKVGRVDVERAGGLDGFDRTWEAVVGRVNGACILSSAVAINERTHATLSGTYKTGSLYHVLPPANPRALAICAKTRASEHTLQDLGTRNAYDASRYPGRQVKRSNRIPCKSLQNVNLSVGIKLSAENMDDKTITHALCHRSQQQQGTAQRDAMTQT